MPINQFRDEWNIIIAKKWGLSPHAGHIKVKAVRCNKPTCRTCPHEYYAYLIYYLLGKRIEKYLGKCDRYGRPDRTNEKIQKLLAI